MASELNTPSRRSSWQFSLKSLMFLMFVVALCAGTISISPPLAIVVIPYVVVAAARTALFHRRIVPDEQAQRTAPGLLATFVRSLLLLVALTIMCLATMAAVGTATALIAATLAVRILAAICVRLGALAPQARRSASVLWRGLRSAVQHIHPYEILTSVRSRALVVTTEFYFASCRLLRQCWRAEGVTQATRTEPL